MRFFISTSAGATMAFVLFLLMSGLISDTDGFASKKQAGKLLSFVRVPQDESVTKKRRERPDEPKPIEEPEMPRTDIPRDIQTPDRTIDFDFPTLDILPGPAGGPFLGPRSPGQASPDGNAIRIISPTPRYPRDALTKGIEGWVDLEFTITETGTVTNATVIDAHPNRIFNKAALQAIYRSKFRPRVINGVATPQRATQRMDFVIESVD